MTEKQRIRALELKVAKLEKLVAVLEDFRRREEVARRWELECWL